MRQAFFAIAVLAMICIAATAAHAGSISVDVTYTADDEVTGLYLLEGSTVTDLASSLGTCSCDWRSADTVTLTGLDAATTYEVIFRVANKGIGSMSNPAELLVEISGTDLTGDLLSSSSWDYAVDTGKAPGDAGFAFSGLTWSSAVEDYKNGDLTGAKNSGAFGGPVAGISKDAYWIWSTNQFSSSMDSKLWLRGSFTTSDVDPVPEPTSLALFGLGAAGLAIGRRRARRLAD